MPVETYAIESKMTLHTGDWDKNAAQMIQNAEKIGKDLESKLTDQVKAAGEAIAQELGKRSVESSAALQSSIDKLTGELRKQTQEVEQVTQNQVAMAQAMTRSSSAADVGAQSMGRFDKALEQADNAVEKMEESVRKLARETDDAGGKTRTFAGSFAEGQAMGDIAMKVASSFREIGEAASEASIKLRTGETSIGGALGEAARAAPILGDFIKGWDGVTEVVTGAEAKLKLADERIASVVRSTEAMLSMLKRADEFQKEMDKETRPNDRDDDLIQKAEAEKAAIESARQAEQKKLAEQLDKARKAGGPDLSHGPIRRANPDADEIRRKMDEVDKAAAQAAEKVDRGLQQGLTGRQTKRAQENELQREPVVDPLEQGRGFREAAEKAEREAQERAARAAAAFQKQQEREQEQATKGRKKGMVAEFEQAARERADELNGAMRDMRKRGEGDSPEFGAMQREKSQLDRSRRQISVNVDSMDEEKLGAAIAEALKPHVEEETEKAQRAAAGQRYKFKVGGSF